MEILIVLVCALGLISWDKRNKEYAEDRLNKIEAELEDIRQHLMYLNASIKQS